MINMITLGLFTSFFSFFFIRSHFLMCLLVMEFFLLYIFFLLFFFFSYYFFDYYFVVIYLVFGVCDSVLGLSLLVFLIRSSSGDYLDSLSLC
nr:NADH dehydrogenase subunit 4L [Dichoptera sp. WW-2021a]